MIFDQMAEMVERWCPEFTAIMDAATVIRLDGIAHRFLAKRMSPADLHRLDHQFCLPSTSGIVAVEDKGGCVILASGRDRFGIRAPRLFLDCITADASSNMDAFNDPVDEAAENQKIVSTRPAGTLVLTVGSVEPQAHDTRGWQVAGRLDGIYMGTLLELQYDPDKLSSPTNPVYSALTMAACKNAMTALEEIAHIEAMPLFNGWPSAPGPAPAPGVVQGAPQETLHAAPPHSRGFRGFRGFRGHIRRSHERSVWNIQDTGRIEVLTEQR